MDNITVKCKRCGAQFAIPASMAGQKVQCSCGESLQIPAAPAAAPPKPAKWYISVGGQSVGPHSLDDLRNRIRQGQLRPEDKVYGPGSDKWRPVRDVPELAQAPAAPPPPVPPPPAPAAAPPAAPPPAPPAPKPSAPIAAAPPPPAPKPPAPIVAAPPPPAPKPLAPVAAAPPPAVAPLRRTAAPAPPPLAYAPPAPTKAKKWVPAAIVVAVAAVAGVLVLTFGKSSSGPASAQPTEAPAPTGPAAVVRQWLDLFVKNPQDLSGADRQPLEQKLQSFCLEGRMDIYAEDVRAALQKAFRSRDAKSISVAEVPCELLRAADAETFCYHVPFGDEESSVTVRAAVPKQKDSPEWKEAEKTFKKTDFRKLRAFHVMARGKGVHERARVLAVEASDGLKIVALGRLAYVGAKAGMMQIQYVTGVRSQAVGETECMAKVGAAPITGLTLEGGKQWTDFGELMSLDCDLVPRSVLSQRVSAEPGGGSLLIRVATGRALSEATHRYGDPQLADQIDPSPSAYLKIVGQEPAGSEAGAKLDVNHYGNFALVSDPTTGEIVGFLFTPPQTEL